MEPTSFVPKLSNNVDALGQGLVRVAKFILIVIMGSLPLLFIPGAPALMASSKVFFVLLAMIGVVMFMSLAILRNGAVTLRFSPLLLSWWMLVMAGFVAAILSPSLKSALVGDTLEVHTVGFLAVLGLVMSTMMIFARSKKSIVYVYALLLGSSIILSILHILRIFLGSEILSFGFLASPATTLVGSFNDLGLFLVLTILVSLIALVQFTLPRAAVAVFSVVILSALALLAVINFFVVWLVLALFSLLLLMYSLTKGRFGNVVSPQPMSTPLGMSTILVIGCVFVVATVFLVGGSSLGGAIAKVTNVNYIEVRPSLEATLNIAQDVYKENAFTGFGPNRFAAAWNLYKDQSINETIFWSTPFNAGNGYIPTWLVSTGLLGVLTWLVFLGLFVYTGAQTLLRSQAADPFWYFTATVTFVSALFVWGMSIVYVPGPVILIIGAMSTGLLVVAHQALLPKQYPTYNLLTNTRSGFVLIATVMLIIIGSISVGYGATRHFVAAYTYVTVANIPASETQFTEVTEQLARAYNLSPSATYAREIALYQQANLNYLLQLPEPTTEQQTLFQQTITNGIQAANEAINLESEVAINWSVLGDLYATLAAVKIEGAEVRAREAYAKARDLDPNNPYYVLQEAILTFRSGEQVAARAQAEVALGLKSNYTDALFFISQIDINSGDIKRAITTTESLIALESNNPGRYYQLGVLYGADGNSPAAITAFSNAITLNPSYANARYLRALQYFTLGDVAKTLEELAIVRDLNPDNSMVSDLMSQIEKGEVTPLTIGQSQPISEPATVQTNNDVTTADELPESDLLRPVNVGGGVASDIAEKDETATSETEIEE